MNAAHEEKYFEPTSDVMDRKMLYYDTAQPRPLFRANDEKLGKEGKKKLLNLNN